ncbi:MAG: DMT family transporter [Hyphomicrobiales bacterium]|nr:DMT family transporter [Hyphomicrobiales bacterium]
MTARDRATAFVPFAALIAGAVAIAFAPILVRLSEVGPIPTAFYRLALAVPFLLLMSQPRGRGRRAETSPVPRSDWPLFLLAGAFFAADLASWHWSIKLTSVANATLLANVAPIFVTLASWLIFNERVTAAFLAGLILSIGGVTALVGGGSALAAGNLAGDALGLFTAIVYAGYLMSIGRLRRTHSTARIMTVSSGLSALMLLPLSLVSGEVLFAATLTGWLVLVALALICQAGGQNMIAYALRHVPVAFSSVALLVQPVVAAGLAWFLFGEHLGPLQIAGAVLVLAGIVICRRAGRAPRLPQG